MLDGCLCPAGDPVGTRDVDLLCDSAFPRCPLPHVELFSLGLLHLRLPKEHRGVGGVSELMQLKRSTPLLCPGLPRMADWIIYRLSLQFNLEVANRQLSNVR